MSNKDGMKELKATPAQLGYLSNKWGIAARGLTMDVATSLIDMAHWLTLAAPSRKAYLSFRPSGQYLATPWTETSLPMDGVN